MDRFILITLEDATTRLLNTRHITCVAKAHIEGYYTIWVEGGLIYVAKSKDLKDMYESAHN